MALSPAIVERKLIEFVVAHLEAYLRDQEADEVDQVPDRADVFPLPVPETVVRYDRSQRFGEQELPAVVVSVPSPNRGQPGRSRASWDSWTLVEFAVIATASDGLDARDNAGTYVAALRTLFTTNQDVDGLAQGVNYVADGLTEPASLGQSRFMAFGQLDVQILIRGIAARFGGPDAPELVEAGAPVVNVALRAP